MGLRTALYGLGICGILTGSAGRAPAAAAEVAVIINDSSGAFTITENKLKTVFLKIDRYWEDGQSITPIHRNEGSSIYEFFLSRISGQSSSEALSYWIKRKQTDGSSPPIQVSEDRLVIRLVSTVKGAVGYVAADSLAGHPQGIRVIRTIKE